MTWAALLLAAGIVGFALGRWTRPRIQIGQRQADYDPFATPHGWGGEP